jgi:hypothetical protein
MTPLIVMNLVLMAALVIVIWDFGRLKTKALGRFETFTNQIEGQIAELKALVGRTAALNEAALQEIERKKQEVLEQFERIRAIMRPRESGSL